MNDNLLPVCSPRLIAREYKLSSPGDMAKYTLLHDEHRLDWAVWFRVLGIDDVNTDTGPVFIDSNGVIEAAIAGKGIALVRSALVREELESGLLINPLEIAVNSPIAYYLVYEESAMLQKISRRFRDWITLTAAKDNEHTAIHNAGLKTIARHSL